jgi:hypothetical protein
MAVIKSETMEHDGIEEGVAMRTAPKTRGIDALQEGSVGQAGCCLHKSSNGCEFRISDY